MLSQLPIHFSIDFNGEMQQSGGGMYPGSEVFLQLAIIKFYMKRAIECIAPFTRQSGLIVMCIQTGLISVHM